MYLEYILYEYNIIEIKDALKNRTLKTNEQNHSGIFGGEKNALSEDGGSRGIFAEEYEIYLLIKKKNSFNAKYYKV